MSEALRSLSWPGGVDFLWPTLLWGLVLVPVLAGVYLWLVRRRASPLPGSLRIGEASAPAALRQHLPAVLMALALIAFLVAIARPQAIVSLPGRVETVVLALDMSGSMRATDIKPTRFAAAQGAAKAFVAEQPRHVRVGVVAVAGSAAVVQSPTHQREDVTQAIDRLQPQRGTALGAGLIIALATLLPEARLDVERLTEENRGGAPRAVPRGLRQRATPSENLMDPASSNGPEQPDRPAPGSNPSSVLVLLSDGVSNTGPEVSTAIELANQHGVRVYTVGIGTSEGANVSADGWSMRVRLDEEGLRRIASATGAEYFAADNADDLKRIYRHVGARIALVKEARTEITALLVGFGALLASIAAWLSMRWFNRVL